MKKTKLKVMLANPPWYDDSKPWLWGVRSGSRWPHMEFWSPDNEPPGYLPFPHFLAQAASMLERHDSVNAQLTDSVALGERLPAFYGKTASFCPDILFMETSTPSLMWDLEIVRHLKNILPGTIIGLGGAHRELQNPEWLRNHPLVDFVCFGEYEQAVEEYVLNVSTGTEESVPGMHFRTEDGSIVKGEPRPPCMDLDSYPRYAYHFLPMHKYTDCPIGTGPTVQIWTSRGCPFKCSFCVWPQIMYNERKVRARSVKNVVDEIEWLVNTYNFESFYLDDDTTNYKKSRTVELAQEIEKRNLGVPWSMMARADCMDKETLEACYKAGMRTIKYGVESGSQTLINESGKGLKLSRVVNACKWTKELGIRMHLTFMIGLPGETEETVEETVNFALQLDPDTLQISICTPFPGTTLYSQAEENGWLVEETSYDGFNESSLNLPTISAERLGELHRDAKLRWDEHCSLRDSDNALLKLKLTMKKLPRGSRLGVYGAGKYTRKILPHLKKVLADSSVELVGFLDDAAVEGTSYAGYPLGPLAGADKWNIDHLLLSSDAFEDVMADKASRFLPNCNMIRLSNCSISPAAETA